MEAVVNLYEYKCKLMVAFIQYLPRNDVDEEDCYNYMIKYDWTYLCDHLKLIMIKDFMKICQRKYIKLRIDDNISAEIRRRKQHLETVLSKYPTVHEMDSTKLIGIYEVEVRFHNRNSYDSDSTTCDEDEFFYGFDKLVKEILETRLILTKFPEGNSQKWNKLKQDPPLFKPLKCIPRTNDSKDVNETNKDSGDKVPKVSVSNLRATPNNIVEGVRRDKRKRAELDNDKQLSNIVLPKPKIEIINTDYPKEGNQRSTNLDFSSGRNTSNEHGSASQAHSTATDGVKNLPSGDAIGDGKVKDEKRTIEIASDKDKGDTSKSFKSIGRKSDHKSAISNTNFKAYKNSAFKSTSDDIEPLKADDKVEKTESAISSPAFKKQHKPDTMKTVGSVPDSSNGSTTKNHSKKKKKLSKAQRDRLKRLKAKEEAELARLERENIKSNQHSDVGGPIDLQTSASSDLQLSVSSGKSENLAETGTPSVISKSPPPTSTKLENTFVKTPDHELDASKTMTETSPPHCASKISTKENDSNKPIDQDEIADVPMYNIPDSCRYLQIGNSFDCSSDEKEDDDTLEDSDFDEMLVENIVTDGDLVDDKSLTEPISSGVSLSFDTDKVFSDKEDHREIGFLRVNSQKEVQSNEDTQTTPPHSDEKMSVEPIEGKATVSADHQEENADQVFITKSMKKRINKKKGKATVEYRTEVAAQVSEETEDLTAKNFEVLNLSQMHYADFMDHFKIIKPILDTIFEKFQAERSCSGFIANYDREWVLNLVEPHLQFKLLTALSSNYEKRLSKPSLLSDLYINTMLPEWLLLAFEAKHNKNRIEVLKYMAAAIKRSTDVQNSQLHRKKID